MMSNINNNERQTQQLPNNLRIALNSCPAESSTPQTAQQSHPPPQQSSQPLLRAMAYKGYGNEDICELLYRMGKIYDSGAFGAVFEAHLTQFNNRLVAIKQVLQDKRYKNRELPLMRSLKHCNIVTLLYFFYSHSHTSNVKCDEIYLNLVMEFMPQTVNHLIKRQSKSRIPISVLTIKVLIYQILRALAYIHSQGICHRDIKPNNLLVDLNTGILKVCDFGSAKHLVKGEPNVSYICARYYRAPELLFGATNYTNMIDIWSAGCVLSELLLSEPIFHGESGIDQLVVIISKLGTPSKDQIYELNSNYVKYEFPQIKARPLQTLFPPRTPSEAIDLISRLFEYKSSARIRPLQACAHSFFNELREPGKKWVYLDFPPRELPPLFDFTPNELKIEPALNNILIPNHIQRCVGDGSISNTKPSENIVLNGLNPDFNTNNTF